jgi:hypothetical protein
MRLFTEVGDKVICGVDPENRGANRSRVFRLFGLNLQYIAFSDCGLKWLKAMYAQSAFGLATTNISTIH